MRLFVGSVFVDDGEIGQRWLDLQLHFLRATTDSFDHVVVLSEGQKTGAFTGRTKIIEPENTELKMGQAHQQGLNILSSFFQTQPHDYFLLLDCDAFPIRSGWLETLDQKMVHHEVAALVRAENLEKRFHAAVFLAKRSALPNLGFCPDVAGLDWIGNEEYDIQCPHYQKEAEKVFGLVRSNRVNLHPLACGVYCDLFYHHCCGSGREFWMRSNSYWDHMESPDPAIFTPRLLANPEVFVRNLRGQ